MDDHRKASRFLVIFTVALLCLAVVSPASAQGRERTAQLTDSMVRERVSWSFFSTGQDGGLEWLDKDGTLHVRGRTIYGGINGVIGEWAVLEYNADIHANGSGSAYGAIRIFSLPQGGRATLLWSGTWSQVIQGWQVVTGRLNAQGFGPYSGAMLVGIHCYELLNGAIMHEGYIAW